MLAPFPYFGGKRSVATDVWKRLGRPRHYIEPFCGSAAMLLASPRIASLEVICDANGFIANFWRALKHQPSEVVSFVDYPVIHVDLGSRHTWLLEQRDRIGHELLDANWPGDAKVAGWWLWGQCAWIAGGWCEWTGKEDNTVGRWSIPHLSDAGQGVHAVGKIPSISDAGHGVHAAGKIPSVTDAGRGYDQLLTSSGRVAWVWLHKLANRLERVRVLHGDWNRCLNTHYGSEATAVFLDPPYKNYESLYGVKTPVAIDVENWARDHPELRVAICGHIEDYDLPGWDAVQWSRDGNTYGSNKTKDVECIWYSPGCLKPPSGLLDWGA